MQMATSTPAGTYIVSPNAGDSGSSLVPIGTMLNFAGTVPPAGWLLCRGQAVSRQQFAALFAVIGVLYGAGDGSTTFNVPNTAGRTIRGSDVTSWQTATTGGSDTVMLATSNVPPHAHGIWQGGNSANTDPTGSVVGASNTDSGWADNGTIYAPGVSPGGGPRTTVVSNTGTGQTAVTVTNAYLAVPYIIRAQ